MNINEQKRYVFKKPYTTKMGTIPVNSQVDYSHGSYYFNGGMCDSYSRGLFDYLVNNPQLKNEYLREVVIPINKI